MARYKKLIRVIATEYQHLLSFEGSPGQSQPLYGTSAYALPLLLSFLWEKSTHKKDLLEFLVAVEESSGRELIADKYADLRDGNSPVRHQWLTSAFPKDELTKPRVVDAVTTLSQYYRRSSSSPSTTTDGGDHLEKIMSQSLYCAEYGSPSEYFGACHEVVCASLVRERTYKPAIKLGRHSYGDGKEKPDCVEVAIREVMEGLLFGKSLI